MLLNRHDNPLFVYQFDLISATTDVRFFLGFTDQTLATMLASDNPAGNYFGIQFSTSRDSGTANVAVVITATTLQDTREAWTVNQWTGSVVRSEGISMTVTSNTADTLTGTGWNGTTPASGSAWIIGDGEFQCVSKDGTTQNLQATGWTSPGSGGTESARYFARIQQIGSTGAVSMTLFDGTWSVVGAGTVTVSANLPAAELVFLRLVCGARNLAASSKRMEHTMGSLMMKPSA
jgi:hypothetical protein